MKKAKILLIALILSLAGSKTNLKVEAHELEKKELTWDLAKEISEGKISLENYQYDSLLYNQPTLNPEEDPDNDGLKNKEEIYIYEKNNRKYIGYNSHPLLNDTDGDGIIDSKDSDPLEWNVSARDAAMFTELVYRDDNYIKKVLNNNENLTDIYNNRIEFKMMNNELATYWDVSETYHVKNGFDAVLFVFKSPYPFIKNNSVQVLAIRGTKEFNDIDDDIKLLFGTPSEQAKTAELLLNHYIERNDLNNLIITGHSLGGNLAQRINILANQKNINWINKAYTFNAPKIYGNAFNSSEKEIAEKGDKLTLSGKAQHFATSNDPLINVVGHFSYAKFIGNTKNGHGSKSYFEETISNLPDFQSGLRDKMHGEGKISDAKYKNLKIKTFLQKELFKPELIDNTPLITTQYHNVSIDFITSKIKKDSLPQETKFSIYHKADTSKLGKQKLLLDLIYPDNTKASISVYLNVVEDTHIFKEIEKTLQTQLNKRVNFNNRTTDDIFNYKKAVENANSFLLDAEFILADSIENKQEIDQLLKSYEKIYTDLVNSINKLSI